MTLTEFLLARINEDEARGGCGGPDRACDRSDDRVPAECEAKREIVAFAKHLPNVYARCVLEPMARVYAEHPDYREGWPL